MIYKKTINNRDVYVSAVEVSVFNPATEGYVGGQFAGAYRFDEPPGPLIAGSFAKDNQGKTVLFPNSVAAVEAAFQLAEAILQ